MSTTAVKVADPTCDKPASNAMEVDPPAGAQNTNDTDTGATATGTSAQAAAAADKPPLPKPTKRVRKVSPRSLDKLKNSKELVYAMYRAVQAHERLHKDANTLHGDINPNTIILLDWPADDPQVKCAQTAQGPRKLVLDGALIDYDIPYSVEGLRHLVHPWPYKFS